MNRWVRAIVTYVPGAILILLGTGLILTMPFAPGMMKMAIADTVGFGTSEGLARAGAQLSPWRPAAAKEVADAHSVIRDLPVERFLARDGQINACLHRVEFTILRDRTSELRDFVVHLKPHWRVGSAITVALLSTAGPIVLGVLWLRFMRRRWPPDLGLRSASPGQGPTDGSAFPISMK